MLAVPGEKIGTVTPDRLSAWEPGLRCGRVRLARVPATHRGSGMGRYYVAQACENGHLITSMADRFPDQAQRHCTRCGAPTLTACPLCKASLHGMYETEIIGQPGLSKPDDYCYGCGSPYPWTAVRIEAARELARDMRFLTLQDRESLERSLDDIVRDTPRTGAAAIRVKRFMAMATPEVAKLFKETVSGIATRAAREVIWP